MFTIGLVGGVASGKSLVASEFARMGAVVFDGDKAGHEVLTFPSVIEKLVARWGESILERGSLNRSAIAQIVFPRRDVRDTSSAVTNIPDPSAELQFLESVTHPAIGDLLGRQIEAARESGRYPAAVLDAAVMMKAGWDPLCEHIVFVDVPQDVRLSRALERGLSAEQFAAREQAQFSVEEKRKRADFIIDNSETPQKTGKQVEEVWYSLLNMA